MSITTALGPELDLELDLEADDGVVDVVRVVDHLTFTWAALPAGPRRWAPTDLSVDTQDGVVQLVRLTYRTVGDRAVVIAGALPGVDVDALAERLATPLLFAHHQRRGGGMAAAAVLAALRGEPIWDAPAADGWRTGQAGVGERPVRLVQRTGGDGHLVIASHGVAAEEVTALVACLVPLSPGGQAVTELHDRHRRALAQRWWDAPRAPWQPTD